MTGKEYEYKVSAVNEGGEGEPSTGCSIIAKPEKEKPKFDRSGLIGPVKEIKVKAGEELKIELPIVGAPTPEVIWVKDGKTPIKNQTNG
jgi:titin